MQEHLPSVVPVMKITKWTYTTDPSTPTPGPDCFLVSIDHDKLIPKAVHLIVECRVMKSRVAAAEGSIRYAIKLIKCPELLPKAGYNPHSGHAWIEDQEMPAWPSFTERKNKK